MDPKIQKLADNVFQSVKGYVDSRVKREIEPRLDATDASIVQLRAAVALMQAAVLRLEKHDDAA
jgi:hypothetical protein